MSRGIFAIPWRENGREKSSVKLREIPFFCLLNPYLNYDKMSCKSVISESDASTWNMSCAGGFSEKGI